MYINTLHYREQQSHVDIGHKSLVKVGKIHLNYNGPNSTILCTVLCFGICCFLGFPAHDFITFVLLFLHPHVHHFLLTHRFPAVIAGIKQGLLKVVRDTDECIG